MRGFEAVSEEMRKSKRIFTDEKGKKVEFPMEPTLPTRADVGSAGNDFYVPKDIQILPGQVQVIWTDVKAFMQEDEVLMLFIRSSLAIKQGLMLTNQTGVIDSSYYDNEDNEGNIGISVKNTSGKAITLNASDRIAQGIFINYLTSSNEGIIDEKRKGGMGSSGK